MQILSKDACHHGDKGKHDSDDDHHLHDDLQDEVDSFLWQCDCSLMQHDLCAVCNKTHAACFGGAQAPDKLIETDSFDICQV